MTMVWVPALFGASPKRPVPPLDEADVYLAYHRPWLAIECLREALAEADDGQANELSDRIADIERHFPQWRAQQGLHEEAARAEARKRIVRWLVLSAAALFFGAVGILASR